MAKKKENPKELQITGEFNIVFFLKLQGLLDSVVVEAEALAPRPRPHPPRPRPGYLLYQRKNIRAYFHSIQHSIIAGAQDPYSLPRGGEAIGIRLRYLATQNNLKKHLCTDTLISPKRIRYYMQNKMHVSSSTAYEES